MRSNHCTIDGKGKTARIRNSRIIIEVAGLRRTGTLLTDTQHCITRLRISLADTQLTTIMYEQWKCVLCLLLCLLCTFNGSLQQCLTSDDTRIPTNPTSHKTLYNGQQNFSLDLLAQISKQYASDENIFFSPYSVYHALVMAYFISANHTENALHKVLRFGADHDKVDVLQAYKFDKFQDLPYEFSGANRIYVSNELVVRDCLKETFEEELEQINFKANPLKALDKINGWVENQTRGMIKSLLPADAINEETSLVLANAAFFKGKWESRFSSEDTHKDLFYVTPSENTFVDMMTQEGTFAYGES